MHKMKGGALQVQAAEPGGPAGDLEEQRVAGAQVGERGEMRLMRRLGQALPSLREELGFYWERQVIPKVF